MSDKVHPAGAGQSLDTQQPTNRDDNNNNIPAAAAQKPAQPPPPSFVIQVPKDQIYRVPPPENAHRFKLYTRRAKRRSRSPCCCCLAWLLGAVVLLAVALAVAAGVLYLVFRPKAPTYSVESLSIRGLNISDAAALAGLSPEFDVVVRAENPNKKIGIDYRGGSSADLYYSGFRLCGGSWPAFFQGRRNVTDVRMALTGSGIRLSPEMRGEMVTGQKAGRVPLEIDVRVPVRVRFGAATTWTIVVKARCAVAVDRLTAGARVVDKACRVRVKVF